MEPADVDTQSDSDIDDCADSESGSDELPIWVHGQQRWVSGVESTTTCADLISVLLQNEDAKGIPVGEAHQYQITERWRGVEQPLDNSTTIQDIWKAWGNAKEEVRISLRRISNSSGVNGINHNEVRRRRRSDSIRSWNSKQANTLHPRRLYALATENCDLLTHSSTNNLLKLVLAQGEIIRKQLQKLRSSENQIGLIEDKTHRARVKKHGSNYLLETYFKCLPDVVESGVGPGGDKNSDSGVMTEGESGEPISSTQNPYDRLSPTSSESKEDIVPTKEIDLRHNVELWSMIHKLNKKILKEEELLVHLHISLRKYERNKDDFDQLKKTLGDLRTEMTKSACEIQHNAVVLEETVEQLSQRRLYLNNLEKELDLADQEHEMLQTLIYNKVIKTAHSFAYNSFQTKELNTLV